MIITEFHRIYPDSCEWKITPEGVQIAEKGAYTQLIRPGLLQLDKARKYTARYEHEYAAAAKEYEVPVELLIACSMTESASTKPETCVREEPGYVKVDRFGKKLTQEEADNLKPNRVSAGFCQLLIITAREIMQDQTINREWLFNVRNSLRACAAYIKKQSAKTFFDPILVACAYNAGGLYHEQGAKNHWKLRQFPIGTSNMPTPLRCILSSFHAINRLRSPVTCRRPAPGFT